jgi:hypothetical protein
MENIKMHLLWKNMIIGFAMYLIVGLNPNTGSTENITLERVDGGVILNLNYDQTYENKWIKSKSVSKGGVFSKK